MTWLQSPFARRRVTGLPSAATETYRRYTCCGSARESDAAPGLEPIICLQLLVTRYRREQITRVKSKPCQVTNIGKGTFNRSRAVDNWRLRPAEARVMSARHQRRVDPFVRYSVTGWLWLLGQDWETESSQDFPRTALPHVLVLTQRDQAPATDVMEHLKQENHNA